MRGSPTIRPKVPSGFPRPSGSLGQSLRLPQETHLFQLFKLLKLDLDQLQHQGIPAFGGVRPSTKVRQPIDLAYPLFDAQPMSRGEGRAEWTR